MNAITKNPQSLLKIIKIFFFCKLFDCKRRRRDKIDPDISTFVFWNNLQWTVLRRIYLLMNLNLTLLFEFTDTYNKLFIFCNCEKYFVHYHFHVKATELRLLECPAINMNKRIGHWAQLFYRWANKLSNLTNFSKYCLLFKNRNTSQSLQSATWVEKHLKHEKTFHFKQNSSRSSKSF